MDVKMMKAFSWQHHKQALSHESLAALEDQNDHARPTFSALKKHEQSHCGRLFDHRHRVMLAPF
jgi:hypothetical protein